MGPDRAKVVACSSPVSVNPPGPSRTLLGADHTFCGGVKECVIGRSLCLAHFLTSARENTFQEPLAYHTFSHLSCHIVSIKVLYWHMSLTYLNHLQEDKLTINKYHCHNIPLLVQNSTCNFSY